MPKKIDKYLNKTIADLEKLPSEEEIQALEMLVKYHNEKYFIDNKAEISDEFFDEITERLKKIKPNSPALYENSRRDWGGHSPYSNAINRKKVYT